MLLKQSLQKFVMYNFLDFITIKILVIAKFEEEFFSKYRNGLELSLTNIKFCK